MRSFLRKFTGTAALVLAMTAAFPVSAGAAEAADAVRPAVRAADSQPVDGVAPEFQKKTDSPQAASWGYQIMPSCGGFEAQIRQGAAYWEGATETPGSGKPVECLNGYIADCFGTANAIGCNYGPGQRIEVSTLVGDLALLAAHEFGHEWHPHSAAGCMSWANAVEVMRPTMC